MGRFQESGRVRRPASDTQGFATRGEREAGPYLSLVLPHYRWLQAFKCTMKKQCNNSVKIADKIACI